MSKRRSSAAALQQESHISEVIVESPKLGQLYKSDFLIEAKKRLASKEKKKSEPDQANAETAEAKSELKDYLISANIDHLPNFGAELEIALLAEHYGRAINKAVWARTADEEKKSAAGRSAERVLTMQKDFITDLDQVLFIDGEQTMRGRVLARSREQRFKWAPLTDGFWTRENALIRFLRLIGKPNLTKTQLLAAVRPIESVTQYIEVNHILWQLAHQGKIKLHARNPEIKCQGELHLETARVMQDFYNDLPVCIETNLVTSDLGAHEIGVTLNQLTAITFEAVNASILNMVDSGAEVAADLDDLNGEKELSRKINELP